MSGFNYLKILLLPFYLTLIHDSVEGATLPSYANSIAKILLNARSLPFEDCGSKYLILYLKISSCFTIPCVMSRGSTVDVKVLFDDDTGDISYLKHRVRWIFNTIKTQAQITPDPCDGVHKCLTNDNDGKLYIASILVNYSLPTLSGTMLWESVNEYSEDVICFRIPVVITT